MLDESNMEIVDQEYLDGIVAEEVKAFEEWYTADAMPLEHSNWFWRNVEGDYECNHVRAAWTGWMGRALLSPKR